MYGERLSTSRNLLCRLAAGGEMSRCETLHLMRVWVESVKITIPSTSAGARGTEAERVRELTTNRAVLAEHSRSLN
ncbi:hypothetical protein ROHU_028960 [Labeo rohita]|uniref:Uncharacterized protein n=1 Tax=Labeo rohita TaxID=84645 RepID=A0A498M9A5_LABRO|nr:hypothetical protein ROHU_028960 [Labeo rohita]